jgi:hypothetical protein
MRRLRKPSRQWELLLSAASSSLLLMSVFWHEWIEFVFGVDPDNGNGAVEIAVVVLLAAVGLLLGRRSWVRARAGRIGRPLLTRRR